jgi:hypothetical protein
MIEWFAAHPEITRAAAVAELVAGLGLSLRVEPQRVDPASERTS